MANTWRGVDFDGTLFIQPPDDIPFDVAGVGAPIPKMVDRVKRWMAEGKDVRVVTARLATLDPEEARIAAETIQAACRKVFGKPLPMTAAKDPWMDQLWDDRVVPVIPDTGEVASHLHEFSSTQVNLTAPLSGLIRTYSEETLVPYELALDGIEYEPHITVKYGLETDDPNSIALIVNSFGPIRAKLGELIVFHTEASDVLVSEVTSEDLQELNGRISAGLPNVNTYPIYHPHMTLAYLKQGVADKYAGNWPFVGEVIDFEEIQFSDHWGRKTTFSLLGPESPEVEKARSPEYLHAVLQKAKQHLPLWLWKQVHAAAMPAAGGKARWSKFRQMQEQEDGALIEQARSYSPAYLEKVLEKAKEHLPDWLWKDVHKLAFPSAGGRARWRKNLVEKSIVILPVEFGGKDHFLVSAEELANALAPGTEAIVKKDITMDTNVEKDSPTAESVHVDVPLGSEGEEKKKKKKPAMDVDPLISVFKEVPPTGPENAPIAFIEASPGKIAAARRKPMVGPVGETFQEAYLKPLGLNRQDVFISSLVPVLLTEADGRPREPNSAEIRDWETWSISELAKARPRIVVALGQTVRKALGELVDFTLPHPVAVRRLGDSGELSRKLRQISRALAEKTEKSSRWDEVLDALNQPSIRWRGPKADGVTPEGAAGYECGIAKADEEKQLVYGIVLEPDTIDTQADTISAQEIEKTAHDYLAEARVVGKQHRSKAPATPVESYIAPVDFKLGGNPVQKGSWVLVVKVEDPDLWEAVKAGEYTGFSVGGKATREPVRS